MKCPKCGVELRIRSNTAVRKSDGTYAYKMVFTCQNRECANYLTDVETQYTPFEVVEEDSNT